MTSFYTEKELLEIGLKCFGKNVLISRKCSIYSPQKISIGDNVRIDDFCILSGEIILGSYVHISAYAAMYGQFGIELEDYTNLSVRSTIFTAAEDFSGDYLMSPLADKSTTNVIGGKVLIRKYSQITAHCVVLPSVTINEGVTVGAMSLVNKDLEEWGLYAGIPAKRIKDKKKGLLNFMQLDEK
jgi:galactoside O-acetyltransferase